ncbi:MAG: DNA-protecting protein DprA [Flavobacteriales bacterium]|nr:DNA-protecting protein DprA [Flavobacteriales bacterium]
MRMTEERTRVHQLALSMLKGIGPVNARNLVAYCGGVDALFTDKAVRRKLEQVPGIGPRHLATILDRGVLKAAEREWELVQRNGVRMLFYLDPEYPYRLRQASDAPVVLFTKGSAALDPDRTVAIVGTRTPTEHGKGLCEELVEGLVGSGATIISGLAFGIDVVAHRTALRVGLPTIAAVAHGLDRLYPGEHATVAREMIANGGAVVSELPHHSPFAPGNFPARNRIIAGMSDCTIVVESGPKGGSLITADIANGYDREVMAYPGRPSDPRSGDAIASSSVTRPSS